MWSSERLHRLCTDRHRLRREPPWGYDLPRMCKRVGDPRRRRPLGDYRQRIDGLDQRRLRDVGIEPAHVIDRVAKDLILDVRMHAVDDELRAHRVPSSFRTDADDSGIGARTFDRGLHLAADSFPDGIWLATGRPENVTATTDEAGEHRHQEFVHGHATGFACF